MEMIKHELNANVDGFTLVVYLSEETEFAEELGSDYSKQTLIAQIKTLAKDNYPFLKISVANVVVGGFLVASFPLESSATERNSTFKIQPIDEVYTVGAGETISNIAAKFGVNVDAIKASNFLRSDDDLEVGQRLVIPGGRL